MNGKIIVSVLISFSVVFSLFFIVYKVYFDQIFEEKNEFYKTLDTHKQKIFLLGSSHVAQLNVTLINEKISSQNTQYDVYNLAYVSDRPKLRYETISKIISSKPELVLYGISYRDFSSMDSEQTSILPVPKPLLSIFKITETQINPKLVTLELIRQSLKDTGLFPSKSGIDIPKTPFYLYYDYVTDIETPDELEQRKESSDAHRIHIEPKEINEQSKYFKKNIQQLLDNNIRVIIFTTPLHRIYLDIIPNEEKTKFSEILDETINELDVDFYNLTNKYDNLDIWTDDDHIAYNRKAMKFTEDIIQIIETKLDL